MVPKLYWSEDNNINMTQSLTLRQKLGMTMLVPPILKALNEDYKFII